MDISKLDVLSATAADLRDFLQTGQASSVQLVKAYQSQISRHDATLNAFISLAPEQGVIAAAASLDKERLEGRVRSQLHGIPVVVKVRSVYMSPTRFNGRICILTVFQDCFITAEDLGMSTTAGSWALVGAKSSKNSALVQKLLNAGMIILGKTNMTVRKLVVSKHLCVCANNWNERNLRA